MVLLLQLCSCNMSAFLLFFCMKLSYKGGVSIGFHLSQKATLFRGVFHKNA